MSVRLVEGEAIRGSLLEQREGGLRESQEERTARDQRDTRIYYI